MDLFEKTLEKKSIYKGKIIDLDIETVLLPNGKTSSRELVRHRGGVAIIAFKDEHTIILVEQFRKPINDILLEIPAGKLELNEEIESCGIRELEEETGYKSDSFVYLGKVITSPGFCDEYIYFFRADKLYKGNDNLMDEDEFINIKEVKVIDLKKMVLEGKIIDAKTICAFTLAGI